MKKYLLPNRKNTYKANLHAHSTVSDGAFTPEQLKKMYKSKGYSILAFTDHELLVDHSELDDKEFLTLTSLEYAFVEKEDYFTSKTIELNMYAKQQHNTTQVCYNPKYVLHGELWRVSIAKHIGELYERAYTVDNIQRVIDTANANGFIVSLNHPGYSMETPEFFGKFNGLFAMEIYNNISVCAGVYDYNPAMYDDMLRRGKRLSCIASDDCHCGLDDSSPNHDRYGGFVMIRANELAYEAVISAMENGDFYASQGPVIDELYTENGEVHIKCSDAKYISMTSSWRPFGGCVKAEYGKFINEATFKLPERGQTYFRFDVCDEFGRRANTRAYYRNEW